MIPEAICALAFLIGIFGAFIVNKPFLLLIGLLFVMIVLIVQGKLRGFIRFGYVVLLPLAILLIIIWGFVLRTGDVNSVEDGVFAAIFSVARLALLGAMFLAARTSTDSSENWRMKKSFIYDSFHPFPLKAHKAKNGHLFNRRHLKETSGVDYLQHRASKRNWQSWYGLGSVFSKTVAERRLDLQHPDSERTRRSQLLKETGTAVLTFSPRTWAYLFRLFGVRGWSLAIIICCLNLWSDYREQLKQVYNGRCARGLVSSRHFWVQLHQFPTLIRTIFISLLIDSVERAKRWDSDGLIARLDHLYENTSQTEDCSRLAAILLLILSLAWTVSAALRLF